ncbi:glycine betaine ABC transporter substrate-binding protein [Halococcus thailandensis]|uniref:Glycine/betaine ABC transporter substrate-binding protein n=1 Tax=Halococcus thailandensis JCM 13552 TaxID=1227457 RepID=M0MZF1_9EURY|nr:glycine betaine ABC transporter substrate-binding protein [Halococcus thailandensis]EMA51097.1 glycine/betaine ABC transporter substrate-binding protein [Halococcus thailandensis JCM 13552]
MTTRRDFLKYGGATAATAGMGATAGCTAVLGADTDAVTVSSQRFPEGVLLSYMAIESLRKNTDLSVIDETSLGGDPMNFRAVRSDETDLFWLYTGTAWALFPPKRDKIISKPEKLFRKVKQSMQRNYGLTMLNPAPFNNTYALIAEPEWIEKTGVKTISDFAKYVKNNQLNAPVVLGISFSQRDDGWPGMLKRYGFEKAASNLNTRTASSSLTYQIIDSTRAVIGMGFTTNPQLRQYNLKVLEDDKSFFPTYNPAPITNDIIEEKPQIREPLNAIGPTLTYEKIVDLNKKVQIEKQDPQKVARQYLRSEGLI